MNTRVLVHTRTLSHTYTHAHTHMHVHARSYQLAVQLGRAAAAAQASPSSLQEELCAALARYEDAHRARVRVQSELKTIMLRNLDLCPRLGTTWTPALHPCSSNHAHRSFPRQLHHTRYTVHNLAALANADPARQPGVLPERTALLPGDSRFQPRLHSLPKCSRA